MSPKDLPRLNRLCLRIQSEKDPEIFRDLVRELSELLGDESKDIPTPSRLAQGSVHQS